MSKSALVSKLCSTFAVITVLATSATSFAEAVCQVPDHHNLVGDVRIACIKKAKLAFDPKEISSEVLQKGPESDKGVNINRNENFYCRFMPKDYGTGLSLKFFCHRTDANNVLFNDDGQLVPEAARVGLESDKDEKGKDLENVLLGADGKPLLNAKGKKQKAVKVKIKYIHPDDVKSGVISHERYREVMTEVAGTRILFALGLPADAVYSTKQVTCFGCGPNPYETKQSAPIQTTSIFAVASVEFKMPGKSIEQKEDQGWSLNEIEATSRGTNRQLDYEVVLLAAGIMNHHNISQAKQNRLMCPKDAINKDTKECSTPLAYFDDVGSIFGANSTFHDNPRGQLKGFEKNKVFSNQDRCEVRIAPRSGTKISVFARDAFMNRARNLTPEKLRIILKEARFDIIDEAVRQDVSRQKQGMTKEEIDEATIARWEQAITQKINEIRDAKGCN
jgi:hypothetical protein